MPRHVKPQLEVIDQRGNKFDRNIANRWIVKPRPNDRNMSTQHIATLLGATCCVRLATMLRCVATCWVLLAQVWIWSNLSQQHPTRRNMLQQGGQTHATCCTQQCCDTLRWHVAIVWPGLKTVQGLRKKKNFKKIWTNSDWDFALPTREFDGAVWLENQTCELDCKGWFSLAHKHNISITSENTRDISVSISRRTNPLICLMLFSLAHKHKHKRISVNISIRKTNMFVFLVHMLMLMRKWERLKTNKWVRSSAYAYAYVAGVLTCLCLCNAYACAYAYALVRTGLNYTYLSMLILCINSVK